MSRIENLIGQKFNHLTVIELDKEKTLLKKRTHWICECDCDNHTKLSVLSTNLKSGNTTKCKYCKAENLIGQKFNNLTVIKRVIDENDKVKWQCKCDCGNIIITRADSLRSGHTKSCGCLQRKTVANLNAKDLVGEKFGKLTIIKKSQRKDTNGQYYWFCNCDCGTKNIEISGHNLISRGTLSCGCISSKGEEKIANILTSANIKFKREYIIKDYLLSTGGHPRFDFAILDNEDNVKYFIEYQGEQHYQARGNIFTPEKVVTIQKRDEEKSKYCLLNNIPLLYIPYTKYNDLKLDDLLLGIIEPEEEE